MTRTVPVILKAINTQFDSAYAKSSIAAKTLGDDVAKSSASSKRNLEGVGKAGVVAGGLMVAGFGLAARASAEFEAKMSLVKTLAQATSVQMTQLSRAALTMGQGIGFSAGQVADAEAELVKAGISVSDILGGALKGSLALAAAGQIDVAKATEIATIAMTEFKLQGSDIPHVADLLAAGADKALGGVGELGEALKSGGLVAAQFGVNIETTIGVLASFAQNGLMAESAGTDLRQMLLKLAAPSAQAADTMRRLGISIYDQSGHFVGMVGLAGQLHDKLGKLDEAQRNTALAVIFGARAIVGANILYNEGAQGLQAWIDNINAQGFAMQQASGKMDNLKGDVSKLGAAFQADLIESGTGANGVLRDMTQGATFLLKAYANLPGPLRGGATALLGVGGAVVFVGGAALLAVPRIAALDASLLGLTDGAIGVKAALSGLGAGVGVIAALTGVYMAADAIGTHFGPQAPKVNALTDSLVDLARTGQPVGEFAKTFGADISGFAKELRTATDDTLLTKVEKLGIWLSPAARSAGSGDEWKKAGQDIKAFDTAIAGLVSSGNGDVVALAIKNLGMSTKEAVRDFPQYAEALAGADASGKLAGTSAELLTGKIDAAGAAAASAVSSLGAYGQALNLSKDELKALSDQVQAWSTAIAGFVVPLTAYTDLLAEKSAAEKKSAEATAASTKSSKDSWQTYAHSVGVSLDEYEGRLKKQVKDQQDWAKNMLILSSHVSQSTLDQLARMGKDGAPLVAQMVNASGAQLGRLDTLFQQGAAAATGAMATTLELAQPVLTVIAGRLGQATATKLAGELARGETTVAMIAAQYGVDIANGVTAGTERASASVAALVRAITHVPAVTTPVPTVGDLLGANIGPPPGRHATGGLLHGQGTGTSDSMLIRASTGEFVVNAKATHQHLPLLKAINDAPGFATGGVVGNFNPRAGSLSAQAGQIVRSGGGVDDINRLVAAYDAYLAALDKAAQREKLLADLHTAQIAAAKATAKERAAAQQSVNDAVKALAAFDQAGHIDREKAATDALIASLDKRVAAYAHTREVQSNMYTLGAIGAAYEIRNLTGQMATLEKYSDAWMSVYQKRQQILDGQKQAVTDQLASLNTLLDAQVAAKTKLADAEKTYADKQASLLAAEAKAERDHYAAMAKAGTDYQTNVDKLLAARSSSLASWIGAADTATQKWGSSLSWLTGNVSDQINAFSDWMSQLQAARNRGVSEDVISALGLDAGPQALDQLKQFSGATQDQIDALNAAVARKNGLAADEARVEQAGRYGQLGRDLTAAQESYAKAVADLQAQFQATQADLATQLEQAQTDFKAAQVQYTADLAAIGADQGRSYAAALAAGLMSGLPAVVAAAQALAKAAAAAPAGSPAKASPHTNAAGIIDDKSSPGYGYFPAELGADGAYHHHAITVAPAHPVGSFDDGGWLMPGQLAMNHSSRPEPVFSSAQWNALTSSTGQGAGEVRVFIGDRELTDIVRVEREQGMAARKTANAIAGRRAT